METDRMMVSELRHAVRELRAAADGLNREFAGIGSQRCAALLEQYADQLAALLPDGKQKTGKRSSKPPRQAGAGAGGNRENAASGKSAGLDALADSWRGMAAGAVIQSLRPGWKTGNEEG
ncbi:MAG: hypothetical protein LIO46_04410 [Clostridiales bacterium]|nr:hypothetical protein [Clostridiales bacterium]